MLTRATGLTLFALFSAALLSACSGQSPDDSFDVAVDGLYSGRLSTNADFAVIGSLSHGGSFWQRQPPERLFDWNHSADNDSEITATAISPDGRYAMTADRQQMALWDTTTGENLTYWRAPAGIEAVAISNSTPTGVLAALALDNHTAVVFNASRGRIVNEFIHQNRVRSVDISADGRWLLSGSEDNNAIYWSIESGTEVSRYSHSDEVRLVALSNDHSLAFSVSKYDKAVVWQTRDASEMAQVPIFGDALRRGKTFSAARFNRDNSLLVTGSSDRMVQLWQLPNMQELARWELPKKSAWKPTGAAVIDVGFTQQDGVVAIASNGAIHHMQHY